MKTNDLNEKVIAKGYTKEGENLKVVVRYDSVAICQGVFVIIGREETEYADVDSAMSFYNSLKGDTPYWKKPEYARQIASVILQQIVEGVEGFGGIGWDGFWSWGSEKRLAMFYNDMPTLALRVNGLVHQGWVMVCLNEGADHYEIFVKGTDINGKDMKILRGIYADQLGTTLDDLIEWPSTMTEDEYRSKALADSAKKMGMVCA